MRGLLFVQMPKGGVGVRKPVLLTALCTPDDQAASSSATVVPATAELAPAADPDAAEYPPGVPPTEGRQQISEEDATEAALAGLASHCPSGRMQTTAARQVDYQTAAQSAGFGDSASSRVSPTRPVWIVSVTGDFEVHGPAGTKPHQLSYGTVIVDAYGGWVIELGIGDSAQPTAG
jgi:hypothetical protein